MFHSSFFLQGYYDSYIMKCIEKCEKKPLLVGKYGVYGGIPNFRTPKENQNWFEKMELFEKTGDKISVFGKKDRKIEVQRQIRIPRHRISTS